MATELIANRNAKTEYEIPVAWSVYDVVRVRANSLQEAFDHVENQLDFIPLSNDAEYIDASYQIVVGDADECVPYQDTKDVICLDFECEEDLSEFTDSMLFDSGTNIAYGEFVFEEMKNFSISLDVCGKVAVSYKGTLYHRPSEFPEELKELIRENPNLLYDGTDDIYTGLNNWFEYIFEGDGELLEGEPAGMTKEQILDDMYAIARKHFGIKV